ncbi:arf GTPase activating protein putative [Entamoeba histolytica]|uniref:ARF GTPase activating protein, putative n=3 Tax=Entamoeba histolytica TaxID=5759 RepID=C4LTN6_ENTH1|nr:ARF GTPase activating protein, putative [Entamoeba histolytica HM-1:IMSS]EAL48617.2 ARF GTPase activating protein, putative [Entamoeba histolytica HM-1:IMSS]ENY61643.1 ARF GTPase activating protein, putative [Entamoeba histolytica HM-1:IMSS-A]GAT91936.1 arf GTPase activating protein putative [Entamoeba histolytica]|eukprot:XP_654003.2 ARF GTPase activating protein, putative [Entamoeba histolytica HM-1:IMSS]
MNKITTQIMENLAVKADNKFCFDCGKGGATFVVSNFNIFVCPTCSGIHMEFGHRVKSVSLAIFSMAEVDAIKKSGNSEAKKKWLANRKPSLPLPKPGEVENIRMFIKACFVEKQWSAENTQYTQQQQTTPSTSPQFQSPSPKQSKSPLSPPKSSIKTRLSINSHQTNFFNILDSNVQPHSTASETVPTFDFVQTTSTSTPSTQPTSQSPSIQSEPIVKNKYDILAQIQLEQQQQSSSITTNSVFDFIDSKQVSPQPSIQPTNPPQQQPSQQLQTTFDFNQSSSQPVVSQPPNKQEAFDFGQTTFDFTTNNQPKTNPTSTSPFTFDSNPSFNEVPTQSQQSPIKVIPPKVIPQQIPTNDSSKGITQTPLSKPQTAETFDFNSTIPKSQPASVIKSRTNAFNFDQPKQPSKTSQTFDFGESHLEETKDIQETTPKTNVLTNEQPNETNQPQKENNKKQENESSEEVKKPLNYNNLYDILGGINEEPKQETKTEMGKVDHQEETTETKQNNQIKRQSSELMEIDNTFNFDNKKEEYVDNPFGEVSDDELKEVDVPTMKFEPNNKSTTNNLFSFDLDEPKKENKNLFNFEESAEEPTKEVDNPFATNETEPSVDCPFEPNNTEPNKVSNLPEVDNPFQCIEEKQNSQSPVVVDNPFDFTDSSNQPKHQDQVVDNPFDFSGNENAKEEKEVDNPFGNFEESKSETLPEIDNPFESSSNANTLFQF